MTTPRAALAIAITAVALLSACGSDTPTQEPTATIPTEGTTMVERRDDDRRHDGTTTRWSTTRWSTTR